MKKQALGLIDSAVNTVADEQAKHPWLNAAAGIVGGAIHPAIGIGMQIPAITRYFQHRQPIAGAGHGLGHMASHLVPGSGLLSQLGKVYVNEGVMRGAHGLQNKVNQMGESDMPLAEKESAHKRAFIGPAIAAAARMAPTALAAAKPTLSNMASSAGQAAAWTAGSHLANKAFAPKPQAAPADQAPEVPQEKVAILPAIGAAAMAAAPHVARIVGPMIAQHLIGKGIEKMTAAPTPNAEAPPVTPPEATKISSWRRGLLKKAIPSLSDYGQAAMDAGSQMPGFGEHMKDMGEKALYGIPFSALAAGGVGGVAAAPFGRPGKGAAIGAGMGAGGALGFTGGAAAGDLTTSAIAKLLGMEGSSKEGLRQLGYYGGGLGGLATGASLGGVLGHKLTKPKEEDADMDVKYSYDRSRLLTKRAVGPDPALDPTTWYASLGPGKKMLAGAGAAGLIGALTGGAMTIPGMVGGAMTGHPGAGAVGGLTTGAGLGAGSVAGSLLGRALAQRYGGDVGLWQNLGGWGGMGAGGAGGLMLGRRMTRRVREKDHEKTSALALPEPDLSYQNNLTQGYLPGMGPSAFDKGMEFGQRHAGKLLSHPASLATGGGALAGLGFGAVTGRPGAGTFRGAAAGAGGYGGMKGGGALAKLLHSYLAGKGYKVPDAETAEMIGKGVGGVAGAGAGYLGSAALSKGDREKEGSAFFARARG